MQFVEPIRTKRQINEVKNHLRDNEQYRDLLLFTIGINNALRVSDLLRITIGDLFDIHDQPKKQFTIREKKTNKPHTVILNKSIVKELKEYAKAYPEVLEDGLNHAFFNTRTHDYTKPISRYMVHKMIVDVCESVGIEENVSTHTMRKTFGFMARKAGVSIEIIQAKLNHSSKKSTFAYLGITSEELKEVVMELNL